MRITTWLVGLPLLAGSGYLAIANRHTVVFSLDVFSAGSPTVLIEQPLILFLFSAFVTGFLAGVAAMWVSAGGLRKVARTRKKEVKALKQEIAATAAGSKHPPPIR